MTCRPGHAPRHPDFEGGNQLARTHGVWASDAAEEARRVVVDLLPAADIERFPLVSLIFATAWVRWQRAEQDISRRGEMLGEGDAVRAHPLLGVAARLRRDLLDLAARFGLDPTSEAQLARDRAEASRSAVDLDEVLARGRAAWAAHGATSRSSVGALPPAMSDDAGRSSPAGTQAALEGNESD
jgi:phage terminase small subunit